MKIVFILLIIIGMLVILAPSGSLDATQDPLSAAGILRFKQTISAPAFSLENLDGKQLRLEDFRGKIVLLDFWATW